MSLNAVPPEILNRNWQHSHEEDSADEMVFRPADYSFPPSRGRIGFQLKPDGSALVDSIAPTDGPLARVGTWSVDGDGHVQIDAQDTGAFPKLSVVSVKSNRLVAKK